MPMIRHAFRALQDGISVIQYRIDGTRGMAISGELKWRCALFDCFPGLRTAPASRRTAPINLHREFYPREIWLHFHELLKNSTADECSEIGKLSQVG
jgi:hypothetical protein